MSPSDPVRAHGRPVALLATVVAAVVVAAWVLLQPAPAPPGELGDLGVPVAAAVPVARVAEPVSRDSRRGAAATPGSTPGVDPAWVAGTAAAAGIPTAAVRAYGAAQLAEPARCGLGWTTLAGIGWVESQHGTIGGRELAADGRSSSPILGPALDGRGGFAAIPATAESTTWHGDPAWDHAVGPLQFIPSTWATWAADGDGDGVADPNDIDDAALAAARYLCADGHDLASGEGWAGAIFSYNHDRSYVAAVSSAANAYAERTR